MYYFSPSEKVFNEGASIWEDGIPVTEELYKTLMTDLNKGHSIGVDENGMPFSIPPDQPLPEKTIQEQFKYMLDKLNGDYERAVQYLKSTYPLSEAITWPVQINEAKIVLKWLEDNPTLTVNDFPAELAPFLYSLSASRVALGYPSDLEHLATRVIQNDALFTPALSHVTAIRHMTERMMLDAVAAEDSVALKSITWTFPWPPQAIE